MYMSNGLPKNFLLFFYSANIVKHIFVFALVILFFLALQNESRVYAQTQDRNQILDLINNPNNIQNLINRGDITEKEVNQPDIAVTKFDEAKKAFAETALTPTGNIFYVSPNGSNTGNGSINSPWDLKTALSQPAAVHPGNTIYLRGGIYNVPSVDLGFTSNLRGTAENPIKVMSYPGEWAVIDGNVSFSALKSQVILRINGAYTWFVNFEITNSEIATRKIAVTGSNPPERRANSIDDAGTATKIINLVIHDTGQGIAAGNDINGNEYYGNIVYNNGWDAPDGTHGHGNYIQNSTGTKSFEDNFWFNQFDFNSQVFGSSLAAARNLTWVGNVFFNGDIAWWGPNISNLTVTENYTYNNLFKVGNGMSITNTTANIQNNYLMHGVFLDEFAQNITFKNNTVWYNYNDGLIRMQFKNTFFAPARFTIDHNTYYKGSINPPQGQFRIDYYGGKKKLKIVNRFINYFAFNKTAGSQRAAFAYTGKSWQDDLKFDVNSTWIDNAPTGLKVFVRPNRYQAGRGNIVIYNWDRANVVNVDVSSILNPGDGYELHNVQDYFGDVVRGTYAGGLLTISMVGRSRVKPIGYDQIPSWYHDPLKPNTFPTFGAFVLIKTNTL
jgi:hypothetical protein